MALDWNKQISFSGLKKKGAPEKSAYPTKTYINLMPPTTSSFSAKKSIPLIVLAVIVVVLVLKFGVFDMFGQVSARQAALDAANATKSQIEAQLTNYDKVLTEYQTYEASSLSVSGETVSALDALALLDRVIAPAASVKSLSLDDNVMSLNLTDITLDGLGVLANRLRQEEMVIDVSVSTAATQATASADVSASMIVTLQRVIEE